MRKKRPDVSAVVQPAYIIVVRTEVWTVKLKDVSCGVLLNIFACARHVVEFHDTGRLKSNVGKNSLGKSPVVLKAIAVGATADHIKTVLAQPVLQCAAGLGDILEQDNARFAGRFDPIKFILPIRCMFDQAGHGALGQGCCDRHFHLMAICQKPHIQSAEVAGVAYP